MDRAAAHWRRVGLRALWLLPWAAISLSGAAPAVSDEKVVLLPQLHHGETLRYESHARLDRHVQTKSNVATMLRPGEVRQDLATGVRLTVQEMRLVENRPMMAAEAEVDSSAGSAPGQGMVKPSKVNFTIGGDGGITRAEGLDDLDAEQRLAWQFWVAQFAFGWTLPAGGVKPGEKWKSEEVEKTPTPIANLVWERETAYVQNDRCPILRDEQCAVFLTSSTLKQMEVTSHFENVFVPPNQGSVRRSG